MTQPTSPPDLFPTFRALRRSIAPGFRAFARAIRRHLGFVIALGIVPMVPTLLVVDLLLGGRYVSRIIMLGIPLPSIPHQTLHSPIQVEGWDENGLLLEDGRRVQLPGFTKLPLESAALAEAVSQGVQITRAGRVHGLVRVPIRESFSLVQTVDISLLLLFLGQGEPRRATLEKELSLLEQYYAPHDWFLPEYPPAGLFMADGWNVHEFDTFGKWVVAFGREAINAPEGTKPPAEASAAPNLPPFWPRASNKTRRY